MNIPEWIRLLPLGEVALGDGRESFQVDAASLSSMVNAWKARGNDLVIDYEHQSLSGGAAPAAGWIKELTAKEDGLWAKVEWTPQAQEYLSKGEYRYFSPVLRLDPKTRSPLALLHMALTNVPAINHLPPLATRFGGEEKDIVVLAASPQAGAPAPQAAQEARAKKYGIAVKEGGNVTKPGQWAQVPDEQFADPVNYRYPMPDHDQCEAAWGYWNQAKNQAQYTPAERAKITESIKSRAKAVGMQISAKEEATMAMLEKLKEKLGLKPEAADAEILVLMEGGQAAAISLKAMTQELVKALELKEDATPAQIKGAILALKQGQDQFTNLQTEVAALKTEAAQNKAQTAVTEALKAGKIIPAQQEWALKYAAADPEGFKVYVEKAVKLVPVGEGFKLPTDKGAGPDGLTPDELAVCKQMGVKAEAFKITKQQLAEQATGEG